METIVRIGLDTSKSVFQLHGVDVTEQPVLRRRLRRGQVLEFFRRLPPALVALEACGASTIGRGSCNRSGMKWR